MMVCGDTNYGMNLVEKVVGEKQTLTTGVTIHKTQNIHPLENPGERQAGLAPRIRARTDGATPASWLLEAGGTPKQSTQTQFL